MIIVADRETRRPGKPAAGLRHALDARDSLADVVRSVRIVGAREGKDAADHLFHGYGLDEFEPYQESFVAPSPGDGVQQTFVWHTGPDVPSVTAVEWIAYPFVARGTHVHVIGDPKVGKTTYLLALADAVASGTDFLGQSTIQMPVVYLNEQTQTVFWQQLTSGLRQNPDFHYATYFENAWASWPDFIAFGVDKCLAVGSQLLVIDTVGKFARLEGDDENSAGAVGQALGVLDQAKSHGISPILAKHSKKSANGDHRCVVGLVQVGRRGGHPSLLDQGKGHAQAPAQAGERRTHPTRSVGVGRRVRHSHRKHQPARGVQGGRSRVSDHADRRGRGC